MSLTEDVIETLIPAYLRSEVKNRLKTGLIDFFKSDIHDRGDRYGDFYLLDAPEILMQSDLINSIRSVEWDADTKDYVLGYMPSIFLSNTCDLSPENIRGANQKQGLFAPVISVTEVLEDLNKEFSNEVVIGFYNTLKQQLHTNLFYLPVNHRNNKEYIVFLDRIYSQPVTAFERVIKDISQERFLSLSNWGFYLFIFKLSYHLCRIPESDEGRTT